MNEHDPTQKLLREIGRTDVTQADPDFVHRLGDALQREHGRAQRSGPMRVLVPVLAAAAMVLVVVVAGSTSGLSDRDSGFADLPFVPTPTTAEEPGGPDPTDDDSVEDQDPAPEEPDATPRPTEQPVDDQRPVESEQRPDATDRPRPTLPPESSTTTVATDDTTPDPEPTDFDLRSTARRADDRSVRLEWTIEANDVVAGWRVRRITADGPDAGTTILVTRDADRRRLVDEPGPEPTGYIVVAIDAEGTPVAETRTRPI